MNSEGITATKALAWKESHNLLPFIAFCILITIVVFSFVVFGHPNNGDSAYFLDSHVAYAPFVIAMMSGSITVISIRDEMIDRTMEALLCTPLNLVEIIFTKYLFIVVVPYILSLIIILPLLSLVGMPVMSWTVLYQMIVDLPMVSLFLISAMMAWLLRHRTLYGILSVVGAAGFILTFLYFIQLAPFSSLSNLLLSPALTTVVLIVSLSLLFLMTREIGSFEKSDVI